MVRLTKPIVCTQNHSRITALIKKETVILTGASGFVGGFIVDELLSANFDVVITARKSSNMKYLPLDKITVAYTDLNDQNALHKLIADYQPQYFIHNAGLTRHPNEDKLNEVNAHIIANIAHAINQQANAAFKRLIFTSSLAAYGPTDFQVSGQVDVNSKPHPVTAYGRSKLLGERFLKEKATFDYIILRPTAVYGPREKDLLTVFKTINKGIQATIGGSQSLSFIYVKDLAKAIVSTLKAKLTQNSYFVTDENSYSNSQLNEVIKFNLDVKTLKINLPLRTVNMISKANESIGRILGFYPVLNKDKYNEVSARSWNCNGTKLWQDLAIKPQYNLEQGIKETVSWYRLNKWI